ncbi:MAG: PQQ-dependent sugar dehydrogenase [bacterium]|jgi:glucose/arabinose dehydrogenase|nr:PQQ-dependent sugar dehydrogenase [bacterium]
MFSYRFIPFFVTAALVLVSYNPLLWARSFRVSLLPNGSVFQCANCHVNSFGGGTRTPFGEAVRQLVSVGGTEAFWSPTLAMLDSDGDGFTNGQELQDPSGNWQSGNPTPGETAKVTNPGLASSVPENESIPQFQLIPIASGFTAPVAGTHAGDGSNRLFIAEQVGRIQIIQDDVRLPEPFLDIQAKLVPLRASYDERGLLGLAFHPNYKQNGRFFVYYSAPRVATGDHRSILAEYQVSAADPNQADPASERIILTVHQPESNHNGGQLAFGPDGYLYLGLGDGGGANDQHGEIGNGQDITNLLGSILRIDIDQGDPYGIPEDNPFVGKEGRDEIWAFGLRNPWKFSFDRSGTHQLFCADVGQNMWEEIDIIEKGGNYGWRVMEGTHCFNPATGCDPSGKILPIAEYGHDEGDSVIGGYLYRRHPDSQLYGYYIFADWRGVLFYLNPNANWKREKVTLAENSAGLEGAFILSMAEDEIGDLYVFTTQTAGPSGAEDTVYKLKVSGEELAVSSWQIMP